MQWYIAGGIAEWKMLTKVAVGQDAHMGYKAALEGARARARARARAEHG